MGSQPLSQNAEAAIWARLMQAQRDRRLSPEAAEFLLAIDFGESDQQANAAIGRAVGGWNFDG
jgi:hypothetical protein